MARFRLPDMSDPKAKTAFILSLGGVLIVVLFFASFAIPTFSNPKFCNTCHSQQADVSSWQKSSHANVTCYGCHVHPGLANLLIEKAKAMSGIYFEVSGNYGKPINSKSEYAMELPAEVCERCHNLENRQVTSTEGIIINHKVHLEREINCTVCHNRVAHSEVGKSIAVEPDGGIKGFKYQNFMKMEGCFRCHTTKKENAFLEEFPQGKGAPAACTACHPKNWSKMPVGHAAGWRKLHGEEAKKNINGCYNAACHTKEEFCNTCHGE